MSDIPPNPESVKPGAPAATVTPAAPGATKPAAATPAAAKPVAPPPPPVPAALAKIPLPFVGVDYALRGYHADAAVPSTDVVKAAEAMDTAGFALDTITGLDWIAQNEMEVVYDYYHPSQPWRVEVRTRIHREKPELSTISKVYPGANWHERETHDFFGIIFTGHPDLSPFLLPEDATFHPLRKDFAS